MNVMADSVRSGGDIIHLSRVVQSLCMTEEAFRKMEERGSYATVKLNSTLDQFVHQMGAVDGYDSHLRAKNIRVPTRVIHGRSDIMVPPHMGKELAAEIKGADMVYIDGGGHTMPPKAYIEAFLEHILRHPII
jgi:pimeloyl-ACP methyl ester carboxylesterase